MTRIANLTTVIATLERPGTLARCLDALLEGDVLPVEVIIVDQSHTDETQSIVEQYKACEVRIRYMRQKRRGVSASRNAAIAQMSTGVLAVTDDDCVPDPGWIAAIDRVFALPNAPDVVTGRVLPLGPEIPGHYPASIRSNMNRLEFRGKVEPWIAGTGGNFAVRRAWLDRIGLYDERLGPGSPGGTAAEDIDLLYRLLRAGAIVRYDPDALIYHQRQSKVQRIASRSNYGRGMGAFCGIWIRHRDRYAVQMLARWLLDHSHALAGALRRRQWMRAYEESLLLRGSFGGLVYGLRVGALTCVQNESLY